MGKKVLLVEGRDDEHVFKALCGRHGLPQIDEIKQHEGCEQLLEAIPVRLTESDVDAVGIVIDANSSIESRWQSVRNHIKNAGYGNVPDLPLPDGLVVFPPPQSLLPRCGVWIMPDNRVPGILEDFLLHLVPKGDRLYEYTVSCVSNMDPNLRLYRAEDEPKARIHTWLAWQDEPGRPLGQSITRGVLLADSVAARKVISWLKATFFP